MYWGGDWTIHLRDVWAMIPADRHFLQLIQHVMYLLFPPTESPYKNGSKRALYSSGAYCLLFSTLGTRFKVGSNTTNGRVHDYLRSVNGREEVIENGGRQRRRPNTRQ